MKITREQLRTIVGEVLQEEKDYQSFFQAMLKKHGVSSPDEFKSDDEKKAFFNKVDSTWKGVSEKLKGMQSEDASEVNSANIPSSVSAKLDQATDKMRDSKMSDAQKLQIIARVIDAIGMDKFKLASNLNKLRVKMEMTEEELTAAQQKIDLNKNGKVDGDDLSKLRAGTKTEAELSAAQQKIDLNKNGKVDGSDLSKLRAGAKTEGEDSTSLTQILSKENETLVKSGAGNMYNVKKVK